MLAASLDGLVGDLEGPWALTASPVNFAAARTQVPLLRRLSDRLADLDRPVSARGVLLVEQLLTDGFGPLYERERAGELRPALITAFRALEAR